MRTIDNQVYQMITRKGFIALFWAELNRRRGDDPTVTYEQVFKELNERYLREFGEPRYRSYNAFRMYRDRHK